MPNFNVGLVRYICFTWDMCYFQETTPEMINYHYNDAIMVTMASRNHQPHDCSDADQRKKSKLRVTGLCAGNSPVTGDLPAQRASHAENVSIWWRHHVMHSHMWHRIKDDFLYLQRFCCVLYCCGCITICEEVHMIYSTIFFRVTCMASPQYPTVYHIGTDMRKCAHFSSDAV